MLVQAYRKVAWPHFSPSIYKSCGGTSMRLRLCGCVLVPYRTDVHISLWVL